MTHPLVAFERAQRHQENGGNSAAGCQYIRGEPSTDDGCKCGRPTANGSSYCAVHHSVCYLPLTYWSLPAAMAGYWRSEMDGGGPFDDDVAVVLETELGDWAEVY